MDNYLDKGSSEKLFKNDLNKTEKAKQIIPIHNFIGSPLYEELTFNIGLLEDITPVSMYMFPHRHSFYEILYIREGKGYHIIDFETYSINPDTLYFISPGQIHFWQANSYIDGILINFAEDFLLPDNSSFNVMNQLDFFNSFENVPKLTLTKDQIPFIAALFEELKNEFNKQDYMSTSVLRSYMNILLVKIQRLYLLNAKWEECQGTSMLIRQFKKLVSKHFLEEHSVKHYADAIGVSTGYLAYIVKKETGYTPGQLIRRQQVLEAKHLLVNTDLSIAQVSYCLRFEDPSYFCRFFKREALISPDSFRKQMRKRYGMRQESIKFSETAYSKMSNT